MDAIEQINEICSQPQAGLERPAPSQRNAGPERNGHQAREIKELPDAPLLAKRKPCYVERQQERPVHRVILEYAAQGYNIKEIAKMVGHTTVMVNDILRQPHAQQTLVNEIRRISTVDEEVVEVIKKNVLASAKYYESVLADEKASRQERMEAADRFMNRRYGKAVQPMSSGSVIDLNSLSDEELAKLLPTAGTGTT